MHKFSLTCLGVGDGWPSAKRNHSAFLYRFGETCFLIDCGEPVGRILKASGLSYNLIDQIVLSHLHFDHIGGLFMLIQGFWLEGRTKELPIHVPPDGIAPLRQLLQAACIFDELLPFRITFDPLQAARTIAIGHARVTPFPTTHLARLRESFQAKYPLRFDAFSFVVETEDLRVGHTADLGAAEDLTPLLEKPLDLLVCELAHIGPEQLFSFLQGRKIGRILFVHLAREFNARISELRALADKMLGAGRAAFPLDGEEFVFD